ncbi:hypothetical protein IWX90DRAFT_415653 [Phyllosticta citrichinensis]|uniref:Uncharacterized protein n=1 Tax=Phyllosticta citrichinensis TaxID=1130410 RepID=A0ABR1XQ49_9PEZI
MPKTIPLFNDCTIPIPPTSTTYPLPPPHHLAPLRFQPTRATAPVSKHSTKHPKPPWTPTNKAPPLDAARAPVAHTKHLDRSAAQPSLLTGARTARSTQQTRLFLGLPAVLRPLFLVPVLTSGVCGGGAGRAGGDDGCCSVGGPDAGDAGAGVGGGTGGGTSNARASDSASGANDAADVDAGGARGVRGVGCASALVQRKGASWLEEASKQAVHSKSKVIRRSESV